MARPISTVITNVPIMVFLPAQGGWFRATVQPVEKGGRRDAAPTIRISGQRPSQIDMHNNLTVAHATHWEELLPDPLSAEDQNAYDRFLQMCALRHVTVTLADDGRYRLTSSKGKYAEIADFSNGMLNFVERAKDALDRIG